MKKHPFKIVFIITIAIITFSCKKETTSSTPTWNTYVSNGLMGNLVLAIAIDAQDNKWFGNNGGGVSKLNGENWTTYIDTCTVEAIAVDALGNKWFGTLGEGVLKYDGTNWITYNTGNDLATHYVISIAIDSKGNKWFGSYGGVSKYDGTNWTSYNTKNGLLNNIVFAIAIDAQGNKWFGTSGGVSELSD